LTKTEKHRNFSKSIIFFGPDGAGKTTLAQLLVSYFQSKGNRSKIAWMRARHSIAFFLAKFLKKMGYVRIVKSPNGCISYRIFDPSLLPKMKQLWYGIEFVSILPWIITRVYVPRLFGYVVVSERYVVDTVVYLDYWLGGGTMNSFLSKVLLCLIPKDSVMVHMDAETNVLLQRRPEDYVNKDFIVFQRNAYKAFAKSLNAFSVDTTNSGLKDNFIRVTEYLGTTQTK